MTTQPSSSKSQILSKLATTRNIIKNKFERAYMDRMKRERVMSELLKPVTSKIVTLKPTKESEKIEKKNQHDDASLSENEHEHPKNNKSLSEWLSSSHTGNSRRISTTSISDSENDDFTTPAPSAWISPSAEREKKLNNLRKYLNFSQSPKARKVLQEDEQRIENMIRDSSPADQIETVPSTSQATRQPIPKPSKIPKKTTAKGRSSNQTVSPVQTRAAKAPISTRTRNRQSLSKRKGGGMKKAHSNAIDFNFIPYNLNNHVIYEYFDDPNELCERLRLLVSSRMAGNTNHMQEINSIIEELRELGCIT